MITTTVALIASDLQFVSDSQDVQAIKEGYPANHPIHDYDSFFVSQHTGTPVYAMAGIVPYLSKLVQSVEGMEQAEFITGQPVDCPCSIGKAYPDNCQCGGSN